ncbi:MAG: DUF4932 domain-containing protein [Bacteroidota bacterium]
MKSFLKITAWAIGCIILLLGITAILYFSNPQKFEAKVYDAFYPRVKNTEKFSGKALIEIPEVYELMWIACSLTETFQKDENLTSAPEEFPDYHQAIQQQFQAHQDHPLIQKLDSYFNDGAYGLAHYAIRFLSLNYDLDENGRLRKMGDYKVSGILTKVFKKYAFLIPEHKALINDFVEKTDFKSFYQNHQDFYNELTQNYQDLAELDEMWKWLEMRYPNRINSYRIFCSPLTGGFHNTMSFAGKGDFEQALMFVNAPPQDLTNISDSALVKVKAGYSRIVFTEIDHNYVNPLSETYRAEIAAAIPDYSFWNNASQGYKSSHNTFLEYMTFGMYSLFAKTQFEEQWEYDLAIQRLENMMESYRGFYRFSEFNQELIHYYEHTNSPEDMDALYQHMIKWMGNYTQASSSAKAASLKH